MAEQATCFIVTGDEGRWNRTCFGRQCSEKQHRIRDQRWNFKDKRQGYRMKVEKKGRKEEMLSLKETLRSHSFRWRIYLSCGNECCIIFFKTTQNRGGFRTVEYPYHSIPVLSTCSGVSFSIFGLYYWDSPSYSSPWGTLPTLMGLIKR